MQKLRIFTATDCEPCDSITEALATDQVVYQGIPEGGVDVEVHDILEVDTLPLVKEYAVDGVPVAFLETQQCRIFNLEDGQVLIDCAAPVATPEVPAALAPTPPAESVTTLIV